MADYLKIFAEFPTKLWDDIPYIGYASSERGYYPMFIAQNLFLPNGSNILHITLTGEMANRVVLQTHNETKAQIVQVLRNIYGNKVTEPTRLVIAAWETDPLFFGSYSNNPFGFTNETNSQLAASLGRLFFSGEAISANFSGYVHGAYFAGNDTANKIVKDYGSGAHIILPNEN